MDLRFPFGKDIVEFESHKRNRMNVTASEIYQRLYYSHKNYHILFSQVSTIHKIEKMPWSNSSPFELWER